MVSKTLEQITGIELQLEEKKCLNFFKQKQPQLVSNYHESLIEGRKGILHKFAAALLREDVAGLFSESVRLKKIGAVFIMNLEDDKMNDSWETLIQQLLKSFLQEEDTYFVYYFEEHLLVFPVAKEFGFGRFLLAEDILLISKSKTKIVESASDLLNILRDKLPKQAIILQQELENCTANYTMALAYYEQWKKNIKKEAESFKAVNTIHYALAKKKSDSHWNSSLFFEQFATEGHNLHPGSKTKTGMVPKDVFSLSPEFHQLQSVYFVAVKKDRLVFTEVEPNLIETKFAEITELFQLKMMEKGIESDDYRLLPVHEWQYRNTISELYKKEIEEGSIILLDGISIEGGASSSFRTIWPKLYDKPALKLSVNSQMTSTVRSISTQTAMNSVEFTVMMKSIMAKESALEQFLPLNEIAGYSFCSDDTEKSRNLTVVVRENLNTQLDMDELAIPGCSLYNVSPISGKNLLTELVDEYCISFKLEKKEGIVSFLQDYLSIVVPGYLTLMVKYGVALEGHLQNSVPVFKNGQPIRFYFRDWGGSRIFENRLQKQGIEIDFFPGSVSITLNEQEMRNKAYYTVFQNHFGELIVQLCQYADILEKELWKQVRHTCDKTFNELESQGIEWAKTDATHLYEPSVKHKALTTMRLYPNAGYCYSAVSNPLAECGQ